MNAVTGHGTFAHVLHVVCYDSNVQLVANNQSLQKTIGELQRLAELTEASSAHEHAQMKCEIERLRQIILNSKSQQAIECEQKQLQMEKIQREQLEEQVKRLQQDANEANTMKRQFQQLSDEHRVLNQDLQIELVAIRGLYQNASDDIVKLQSLNESYKQDIQQSKQLIAKYRDDMNIIQAQVMRIM